MMAKVKTVHLFNTQGRRERLLRNSGYVFKNPVNWTNIDAETANPECKA
jgi:hypothetical protein